MAAYQRHNEALRVLDDLEEELPISASELDAVEAFLMSLVNDLMADSEAPQCPAEWASRTEPGGRHDQGRSSKRD